MNKFSCTCAGGFEGATCQTGRSLNFRFQRQKCFSSDLLCGEPQSAISENNLSTGYQSSMRDVPFLDFEENWHRRTFKQAINVHRELAVTNQTHWSGTPAGHASAFLICCMSCYSTITFSPLKKAIRSSRNIRRKQNSFLANKSFTQHSFSYLITYLHAMTSFGFELFKISTNAPAAHVKMAVPAVSK